MLDHRTDIRLTAGTYRVPVEKDATVPLFRFLPKEEKFFDLFKESSANLVRAADLFRELADHYDRLPEIVVKIREIEHDGDHVTHVLFDRLNRSFVTPIDREDIHNLASALDDVLDGMEAVVNRLVLFRIDHTTPNMTRLLHIVADAATVIDKAVRELRYIDGLTDYTIEINRLENEADTISRESLAALFDDSHDAVEIIKWKEIYGRLEACADQCEDVANVIDAIVLKNA